jgi:hypothetical protein
MWSFRSNIRLLPAGVRQENNLADEWNVRWTPYPPYEDNVHDHRLFQEAKRDIVEADKMGNL